MSAHLKKVTLQPRGEEQIGLLHAHSTPDVFSVTPRVPSRKRRLTHAQSMSIATLAFAACIISFMIVDMRWQSSLDTQMQPGQQTIDVRSETIHGLSETGTIAAMSAYTSLCENSIKPCRHITLRKPDGSMDISLYEVTHPIGDTMHTGERVVLTYTVLRGSIVCIVSGYKQIAA